ncbi:MAG TPA: dual specificity protein phosphatase [Anaerolineae bacterium]|nr:dual specificity protein phosphatase [Anaerolineae bacterium]
MTRHARIFEFPPTRSLVNARLDDMRAETHGKRRDLIFDYRELRLFAPSELIAIDDQPYERLRGEYVPRRLRFRGLRWVKSHGVFTHLSDVAPDADARSLEGMLCWRSPADGVEYWLLLDHADTSSGLLFSARDWSSPPLLPARLVPKPQRLHRRYGGDPITFHLNGRAFSRRFFVGGMEHQTDQRPDVDAVLNLSEDNNRWPLTAADRRAEKGEGLLGMDLAEIEAEAQWVIDRLQVGQRVLVHCSAGLNRSTTICCAVLMQLEHLSAEEALNRVREHHPWARPDSHHWLRLRWLAQSHL